MGDLRRARLVEGGPVTVVTAEDVARGLAGYPRCSWPIRDSTRSQVVKCGDWVADEWVQVAELASSFADGAVDRREIPARCSAHSVDLLKDAVTALLMSNNKPPNLPLTAPTDLKAQAIAGDLGRRALAHFRRKCSCCHDWDRAYYRAVLIVARKAIREGNL